MFMEKKGLASEEALDYLDADPYVIFGIDDPVTQKALYELQNHDVLVCEGATPSLAEWFSSAADGFYKAPCSTRRPSESARQLLQCAAPRLTGI